MEISDTSIYVELWEVPWANLWVTVEKKRKCSMFKWRGSERVGLLIFSLSIPHPLGARTNLKIIFMS